MCDEEAKSYAGRASLRGMKRLKIAYITVTDSSSRRAWSGTNFYLKKSVEKHLGDVDLIGPLSAEPFWTLFGIFNFITLHFLNRRFNYRDSKWVSKIYAGKILPQLKNKKYDLIIAPAGTATMAELQTSIPIIYINDRCIPGAIGYHEILRNLFAWSKRGSIRTEEKTVAKSKLSIYSSTWAANAARINFSKHVGKIHVIPFGANFDNAPEKITPRPIQVNHLKLLFVGVKWKEKGGDIAYQTLVFLQSKNISVELVVCGCIPPDSVIQNKSVKVEGFLNKEIPAESERLRNHFETADFFILPTRFEAYGLVLCEAASFGLPVLATNTGGISEIVSDNKSGFLFSEKDNGEDYGHRIMHQLSHPDLHLQMRIDARQRFEDVLNWDAFSVRLKQLLESSITIE